MARRSNSTDLKQVKYTVEDLGSVIKGSKKRISWTFTIHDKEEHTVELLWSKNSGKRQVTVGDALVYEETKKGNFFFYKWQQGNLNLHIVASSYTPAKGKVCDGFCKFELIVNGLPFSKFPKSDGTPLPELDGPGPYGIFDIIYPQGYDVCFTKEAPFHKKGHLESVAVETVIKQESLSQAATAEEEMIPESEP